MVIHCYTDGGCLSQGLTNAAAAFGFIFPHFSSYDSTDLIPKMNLNTSSRAEMEAFIHCMGACSMIIKFHNLSNCITDICTDSYDLILIATTWIQDGKKKGWRTRKKQSIIILISWKKSYCLLQKIISLGDMFDPTNKNHTKNSQMN